VSDRPPETGKKPRKPKKPKDLVPFAEVQKRLRLFNEDYRGIKAIPVKTIVGSVDRSTLFDRKFNPRVPELRDRMRQVALAFPDGDFPPIRVFKVSDVYFVRDGHIRVAAAKEQGIEFIDAEIVELDTQEAVEPDTDMVEVIHLEQHRRMFLDTGLASVRPDASIRVSVPIGYTRLRESIAVHGYGLFQERGTILSREEVAADWYDRVYRPAVETLRRAGLTEAFSRSTEADLFLWIQARRQSLFPDRGNLDFDDAAWEAGRKAGAHPSKSTEGQP
jgi:hypothetical protein